MNTKSVKDYYAILGVSQDATLEEIRLAYRKKARAFHPDLSADPHAEDRFREINEAYGVLGDSEKRSAYNSFLVDTEESTTAAQAASETPTAQSQPQAVSPPPAPHPTVNPPPSTAQERSGQRKRQRVYP
ncbi:MAG: DnaJ domain-containing protein, partial [Anaerolineae bacterium]